MSAQIGVCQDTVSPNFRNGKTILQTRASHYRVLPGASAAGPAADRRVMARRPPEKRPAPGEAAGHGPGRGPLSVPSEEHRGLRSPSLLRAPTRVPQKHATREEHRGPDFESFHLLNHNPLS